MLDQLAQAIRDRKVILFVGAGVSEGLGLPSWRALIDHIGEELGFDRDIFASLGDHLQLAEFYKMQKKSIGGLRSWMDVTWHGSGIDIGSSAVHRLITEIGFPLIYTTNYDRWLERAFVYYGRPYAKISNVNDLPNVRDNVAQIVKFHGDFDDDKSIVLTESDYFNRLDFDSPLDVKFRADALGKSILFIGYGMRDLNIRLLLYKLWKAWEKAGFAEERPNSYVFLLRPNAIQEAVLASWGIRAISEDVPDPSKALEAFLTKLREMAA